MTIDELQSAYDRASARLNELKGSRKVLEERKDHLCRAVEELEENADTCKKAAVLIGAVTKKALERVSSRFESVVTPVLKSVLGPRYSFKVEWSSGGYNNLSAEFLVQTPFEGDKDIYVDPRQKGGGVRDVIGFSLRFAFLYMTGGGGFVMLDEAFSQLDRERMLSLSSALRFLHNQMGYQIIFITHDDAYIDNADKVFFVEYSSGKSFIKDCQA